MAIEVSQKNREVIVLDERQKSALSLLVESLVAPLSGNQNSQVGQRIGSYFIENNLGFCTGKRSAGPDFYSRGLSALVSSFAKATGKNINDQDSLKAFIQEIKNGEEGGYLRFFISIVARDVMVLYCACSFAGNDNPAQAVK